MSTKSLTECIEATEDKGWGPSTWPERLARSARAELDAIRHSAKVILSPHDYTLDEYVKASDLIRTDTALSAALAEARLSKASLKAARDQRIARMWNDSMTLVELAGMLGMSPKTVSRVLVAQGLHVPQHIQRAAKK
jgi:hypothetical protein